MRVLLLLHYAQKHRAALDGLCKIIFYAARPIAPARALGAEKRIKINNAKSGSFYFCPKFICIEQMQAQDFFVDANALFSFAVVIPD